jgi:alpha-glucosidase/alpha-D-xyloside xylohydrolase
MSEKRIHARPYIYVRLIESNTKTTWSGVFNVMMGKSRQGVDGDPYIEQCFLRYCMLPCRCYQIVLVWVKVKPRSILFGVFCLFGYVLKYLKLNMRFLPKTINRNCTGSLLLITFALPLFTSLCQAQKITAGDQSAQLDIRRVSDHCIRITLKPVNFKQAYPFTPAVVEQLDSTISLRITQLDKGIRKKIGDLQVEIRANPLTIIVYNIKGEIVQQLSFERDGKLSFKLDGQPILGMGEGGPKPGKDVDWRKLPVQFDRSGELDSMQPRWQSDAYGSRNPVAMLIGTKGWGLFVATPWVMVDLRRNDKGFFIPRPIREGSDIPQTFSNQELTLAKGVPPADKVVHGLYDFFLFDGSDPETMMKDFSRITGPAALPPRWAMGYMQSHRTLEDNGQMLGIVDTFREKRIPIDAVIYLGTGFTPKGWNKMQPSFDFNPEVFKTDPKFFIKNMHDRHMKIIMHMVPWDRDRLPTLHGSIPPANNETVDAGHISTYWKQHESLLSTGVDGFWPDEGDWFNLFERVKRHQLYYQGHL